MVETGKHPPCDYRRSVAMLILGSVLLSPSTGYAGEEFSIDLNQPYDQVVNVVQKVANTGIVQGTFEYKGTRDLEGARSAKSSRAFDAWSGAGTALYKERPNTLVPENFYATGDTGTVGMLRGTTDRAQHNASSN